MAREPVTRRQLDAYRFGQRRLEAALARRDPVLLHEEIRGQRRVVLTGLALAVLALLGAFGCARLADRPAWERQTVIAAKQSGRLYVVVHRPDRLVPVRNVVAARMVLAAAGGRRAGPAPVDVAVIDDAVLDRAPRTPAVAVAGADGVRLPDGGVPDPVGAWAVCDLADPVLRTLLVAGAAPDPAPGPDPGAGPGLLLESPGGDLYLVVGGRRYRMDSVYALQRAYDLVDVRPRRVSAGLLAAIPEGAPLRMPEVPAAGRRAPGGLPARVGDVVRVRGAGGERLYLVLADGVQEVSRPVANLLRTTPGVDRGQPPVLVGAEQLNAVGRARLPGLDDFPAELPRVPTGPDSQAVCWRWAADGAGGSLTVARDAPVPPDRPRTQLARADGAGPELDVVAVPAGRPLVFRAGGGLWLVSDTGVAYRVAGGAAAGGGAGGGNETAAALGIGPDTGEPAPEAALRLLPAGPDLDLQSATRTVDVLVGTAPGG